MKKEYPDRLARLVIGAAVFTAMAYSGWRMESGEGSASTAAPGGTPPRVAERVVRRSGPPEEVGRRLGVVRNAPAGVERLRATIALANSLTVDEIGQWLNGGWFDVRGGAELMVFTNILKGRWEVENPEGMARWSVMNDPLRATAALVAWAKTDRAAVVAFLKENGSSQDANGMLSMLAWEDPALVLEVYQDRLARGITTNDRGEILGVLARSNPAGLEAVLDQLPRQERMYAEVGLRGQRMATAFDSELDQLLERPDGWDLFRSSVRVTDGLGDKVLSRLADLPSSWKEQLGSSGLGIFLEDPKKWLSLNLEGLGFSEKAAGNIRQSALYGLLRADPEGAVRMMEKAKLSPEQHSNILVNILSDVENDPQRVDALMAQLSSPDDQKILRDLIEAKNRGERWREIDTPEKWMTKASDMEASPSDRSNLANLVKGWDEEKVLELGTRFQTLPDEVKAKVAGIFASEEAKIDPALRGDAIRYVIEHPREQPEPERGIVMTTDSNEWRATNYVVELGREDPASAAVWVQSLPPGEAQSWAQKNLGRIWMGYDPEAAERWIQSLPEKSRAEVRGAIGPKRAQ